MFQQNNTFPDMRPVKICGASQEAANHLSNPEMHWYFNLMLSKVLVVLAKRNGQSFQFQIRKVQK